MITDLFDIKKHEFDQSENQVRINTFDGFVERIEEFDDGTWLLFQINKRGERYFVTDLCKRKLRPFGSDMNFAGN